MPSKRTRPVRAFGLSSAWVTGLLGATLVLICLVVAVLLNGARTLELKRASVEATNLSTAITQDINRQVELFDISLQGVLEEMRDVTVMSAPKRLRNMILFDRAAAARFLGAILVIDKNGDLQIDSRTLDAPRINYADRDYFKAQIARDDVGLYFGQPITSRTDGQPIIGLSRRINNPDGSFGGVVVATFHLDSIRTMFSRITLGPAGSLTLFRNDGTIVMRQPMGDGMIGHVTRPVMLFDALSKASEGEYQTASVVDGVRRLYHYQKIGPWPLVSNVGISIDDIYADWWRKAVVIVATLGLCCTIIIVLASLLRAELRRRVAAEAALLLLAEEDSLTGIANRRRFDDVLEQEWRIALRHRTPISLLMIDADHFKDYNDAFGHLVGDHALSSLGRCLRARVRRSGDLAARYGGEEFAVILPRTDADKALKVSEAIRRDVLCLALPHPRSRWLSVSIGAATFVPSPGDHLTDLIAAADAALYASKRDGRNRTTMQVGALIKIGTRSPSASAA